MPLEDLLGTTRVDVPVGEHIARVGTVVRRFGERLDSQAHVVGIEVDGQRFVVKHATLPEAVAWLECAVRFHSAVRHPAIPTVVHHVRSDGGGLALVEEWAPGEVLVDPFDPSVPARDAPGSPWRRLLALPLPALVTTVRQLFDAHVAVTDAGFVAVDLYDGCLLYDFGATGLHLIDLDCYQRGPYTLQTDRQLGSSATMAPEEWQRGATIDERTTVFTLGRLAHLLLGGDRHSPPGGTTWRGGQEHLDVVAEACRPDPSSRFPTVRALAAAWDAAG